MYFVTSARSVKKDQVRFGSVLQLIYYAAGGKLGYLLRSKQNRQTRSHQYQVGRRRIARMFPIYGLSREPEVHSRMTWSSHFTWFQPCSPHENQSTQVKILRPSDGEDLLFGPDEAGVRRFGAFRALRRASGNLSSGRTTVRTVSITHPSNHRLPISPAIRGQNSFSTAHSALPFVASFWGSS